ESLLALLPPSHAAALQAVATARAAAPYGVAARAAIGTAAIGTAAIGTAAIGTAAIGTAAIGTAAIGSATVGTDARGSAAGGNADSGAQTRALGASLLRSFERGELDESGLARLLAALGDKPDPAHRAGLKQALDDFDFPLAGRRLEALLAECGPRRAESTP
ncbi:MAG: Histidine kinase, partial [Betaproteobacteria bacterium]|nr:Histidine kinase [Betaproteobacteria bacterium]